MHPNSPTKTPRPWVACMSSSGQTFESIFLKLPAAHQNLLKAVFVDRDCPGFGRMQDLKAKVNIPFEIIKTQKGLDFESTVLEFFKKTPSEFICFLCGFFGILTPDFILNCPAPIVNTHPSLLPAFPGIDKKVQNAAWEQVAISGITLHLVTEVLDAGPVLFQHPVAMRATESFDQSRERMRQAEQEFIAKVLPLILESQLKPTDRNLGSREVRAQLKIEVETFKSLI